MLELTGSAVAGGASELEKRFLWEGSKRLAHGGCGESGKVGGVGGAGRSLGRSSSGQLLGIGVMAGPGGEWQCGAEATFSSKSRLPPPNSECLRERSSLLQTHSGVSGSACPVLPTSPTRRGSAQGGGKVGARISRGDPGLLWTRLPVSEVQGSDAVPPWPVPLGP